jgi:hypothetical protein
MAIKQAYFILDQYVALKINTLLDELSGSASDQPPGF